MRKKRFITLGLIVAAFGVAGSVTFMNYQDERITYKPNLTSKLEERSDCYLCGIIQKALWDITVILKTFFWYTFRHGTYGRPIFSMTIVKQKAPIL